MYLGPLKAAIVEALQAEFDGEYPYPDFRNLYCSIEYPNDQANYPGLWVDYDDRNPVEVAGIGHQEWFESDDGKIGLTTRWKFQGDISITVVAMSSLERDRIYDELIRVVGFSRDKQSLSDFRRLIEQNDLVSMNVNFDSIKPGGQAAAPGTPWGSSEVIYEKSIALEVVGEFVGDPDAQVLVRLSKVLARGYTPPAAEPAFTGNPSDDHLMPYGWDPYTNQAPVGHETWTDGWR